MHSHTNTHSHTHAHPSIQTQAHTITFFPFFFVSSSFSSSSSSSSVFVILLVTHIVHVCPRALYASGCRFKKEMAERDITIDDKKKRIHDLRKKNQELEKFKFVLVRGGCWLLRRWCCVVLWWWRPWCWVVCGFKWCLHFGLCGTISITMKDDHRRPVVVVVAMVSVCLPLTIFCGVFYVVFYEGFGLSLFPLRCLPVCVCVFPFSVM